MEKKKSTIKSTLVFLLAQLFGFGFICLIFGGIGIVFSYLNEDRLEDYQNTTIVTSANLADAPRDTIVLIDGYISPQNKAIFRDLVTYAVYYYEIDDDDSAGEWVIREYHLDPIWIDLKAEGGVAEQQIQISADSAYGLEYPPVQYESKETGGSYRGFPAAHAVAAYGEIRDTDSGPELRTYWLFGGSVSDYFDRKQAELDTSRQIGIWVVILGVILIVLGGIGRRLEKMDNLAKTLSVESEEGGSSHWKRT